MKFKGAVERMKQLKQYGVCSSQGKCVFLMKKKKW